MNAAAVRPRMCRTSRMLPTVLLLALLGAVVLLGACSRRSAATPPFRPHLTGACAEQCLHMAFWPFLTRSKTGQKRNFT